VASEVNRILLFRMTTNLEYVEEVPIIPSMSRWIERFSGVPLEELILDVEGMTRANIQAQALIGYDALFVYLESVDVLEAFGCKISFTPFGVDVTPIEIESEHDVRTLSIPNIRKDGLLPLTITLAERLVKFPDRCVPVLSLVEGPFTTCCRIVGAEKMMKALVKNRPMIKSLLEKISQFLSVYVHALTEAGIDGLLLAEPVGSCSMVSPKTYQEFVHPCLQMLIESTTIPTILHICGDTFPILDLMAESGARILSLDQCMNLTQAKRIVADRCGLGGNVDPINTLLFGTPANVERETIRCLRQGGKKGYLLMAGCGVAPDTPIENLKTMIKVGRHSHEYLT
jgi:uroporphyrinogen decarboxylase